MSSIKVSKDQAKYIRNFQGKIRKTMHRYKLIEKNDRIMVGVSGGKDSLVLLETIAETRKHIPFKVDITAVHVKIKDISYAADRDFLATFCEKLSVPFIYKEIEINWEKKRKKSACFICSWYRRKTIFDLCRKESYNKLAFGHHMDDAIETMLMNMIFHASISSLPEKLSMFKGKLEIIRPLILCSNAELLKYAQIRNFSSEKKVCPYSDDTRRQSVRDMIDHMDGWTNDARKNILRSMDNIYQEYLPKKMPNKGG